MDGRRRRPSPPPPLKRWTKLLRKTRQDPKVLPGFVQEPFPPLHQPAGVRGRSTDGPAAWLSLVQPTPRLACRLGRFAAERHWRSLTPSHALTLQKRIAYRHGRGRKIYSLIPKGETRVSPFVNPLERPPSQSRLRRASVSPAGSVGRWTTCHRHVAAPEGEPSLASPYGGAGARWAPFCDRSQLPLRSTLNGRHRRPAPPGEGSLSENSPLDYFHSLSCAC